MKARRHLGFTLVELLVAIAILSVLVVTIYSSFASGISAREKGETLVDLTQVGRETLRRMASDLANAPGLSDPGFIGQADQMSFVTLQPDREHGIGRMCHVRYYLRMESPAGPGSLWRACQVFGDTHEEVDLTGGCVRELKFTYAYHESGESGVRWATYWFGTEGAPLPVAVRISMVLESEGQTISLERTAHVPVSSGLEDEVAS